MRNLVSLAPPRDNSHPRSPFRWSNVLGIALFTTVCCLAVFATYYLKNSPDATAHQPGIFPKSFQAFHNQVYYPVRALVTGENPYSADYVDFHPQSEPGISTAMDPVPPSTLLILSPIAFFQLHAAEIVFISLCGLLTILSAYMLLTAANDYPPKLGAALLTAALMIACLPGVTAFFTYPTIIVTLFGVILAVEHGGRNDLVSGFGIVLAFCQPVIGAGILILLLFRRNFSAVALGILLFGVLNIVAITWIANGSGGIAQTIQDAREVYPNVYSPVVQEDVQTSINRVDAWSVLARISPETANVTSDENSLRWIITGGILLLALIALLAERDRTQTQGAISRSGMLIAMVTILYFYQTTSALYLLWIPAIGLLVDGWRPERSFSLPLRFVLGLLVVLPLFNYFTTPFAMDRLEISQTANAALAYSAGIAETQSGPLSLRALFERWEFANPDLAQWQTVVTANSIFIAIAVVIISLRMIFSFWVDRKIIELQNTEGV